mmetsp:Transcript_35191/g.76859  ORF Transcript_35191/g.76859 Transcript_35191/m.76859 type:complete len:202 (+) Transcript_35191:448-1053(+)
MSIVAKSSSKASSESSTPTFAMPVRISSFESVPFRAVSNRSKTSLSSSTSLEAHSWATNARMAFSKRLRLPKDRSRLNTSSSLEGESSAMPCTEGSDLVARMPEKDFQEHCRAGPWSQGCFKASLAVIRCSGFNFSIFVMRSHTMLSTFLAYNGFCRTMPLSMSAKRSWSSILAACELQGCSSVWRMYSMTPIDQTSHARP